MINEVEVVKFMIHLGDFLIATDFADAIQLDMSAASDDGHQPHIPDGLDF